VNVAFSVDCKIEKLVSEGDHCVSYISKNRMHKFHPMKLRWNLGATDKVVVMCLKHYGFKFWKKSLI